MKDIGTISVIIPIYKVEEYLHKCVNSVLEQTYQNLEIILVDDGSPDNCPDICDEYAIKDDRIRVIHKPNGGLSDARNAGIKICTGEYLFFLDSDDFITPDALEILADYAVEYHAELVCTTPKNLNNTRSVTVFSPEKFLEYLFWERCSGWEAWGKLMSKDLLGNLRFEKGRLYEDTFFTPELVLKSKKCVFCDCGLYIYTIRENSIMGKSRTVIHPDLVDAVLHIIALCKDQTTVSDVALYPKMLAALARFLMQKARSISENFRENSEFIACVCSFLAKYKEEIQHNPYVTRDTLMWIQLLHYSPTMFKGMTKIAGFIKKMG